MENKLRDHETKINILEENISKGNNMFDSLKLRMEEEIDQHNKKNNILISD